jgi:small-conductance mechanosensitive channel
LKGCEKGHLRRLAADRVADNHALVHRAGEDEMPTHTNQVGRLGRGGGQGRGRLVRSRGSSVDRLIGVAGAVLALQLAVTVALTGSDRGHALSHLPAAFAALSLLWLVLRLWHNADGAFERWARRGLIVALCAGAITWACEAIAALGWAADGYTERWPALTTLHDGIVVTLSVVLVLLIALASVIALMAIAARRLRAVRSRHAP